VLCSRCSTNLPDGSQFCLKCGQKVAFAEGSTTPAAIHNESTCSKCGTSLHRTAEFCLRCGQPVISSAKRAAITPVQSSEIEVPQPWPARRQHRSVLWLLALVVLGAVLWAATSKGPAAEQVQEFVRWSQTQSIVDSSVSVNPHGFSSWTLTVPPGALNVTVTGEFSAVAAGPHTGKSNESGKDHDAEIEAYVMTDAAFAVWSTGYSAQTEYESGPATAGTINAPLPAGAGIYQLVLSNKNSARAKTVHATVLLRYKSWSADVLVRLKDRFWNWLGQ